MVLVVEHESSRGGRWLRLHRTRLALWIAVFEAAHVAKSLARKPGVEMKCGRFDLERRLTQFRQIEVDGVVWCRTNRGCDARKRRQGRAMNMPGGNKLDARMAPDE